jgi:hypothetical protein
MKIEMTEVYGFKASLRAMRNPKDSWDRSDSNCILTKYPDLSMDAKGMDKKNHNIECFILGDADKKLSQALTKGGSEHCKHLRLIQVWIDMELPRYIWQEFDTYRFVEKVSCSTMHKLMSYNLNETMFEGNLFNDKVVDNQNYLVDDLTLVNLKDLIEEYKKSSNATSKIQIKLEVKRKLPESFLQRRTLNTNYQQLLNIYHQRKNHELPEWKPICEWILSLPWFSELTGTTKY